MNYGGNKDRDRVGYLRRGSIYENNPSNSLEEQKYTEKRRVLVVERVKNPLK
jgi:hypothetical protein